MKPTLNKLKKFVTKNRILLICVSIVAIIGVYFVSNEKRQITVGMDEDDNKEEMEEL